MDIRDKIGHNLEIGDCVVSVDKENRLFIGRIDGLWKTGTLKVTRLTRGQMDGSKYTVHPNLTIKFQPTPELTTSLLRQ